MLELFQVMVKVKDHLIERVIQPLVPCRRAGSGKMATIHGLLEP